MSKLQDPEKQTSKVSTMSSRQQILYLLNKTQEKDFDIDQDSSEEEINTKYSWIEYFKEKQAHIRESIPEKILQQRNKLTKLSKGFYKLINKNIYKDKKRINFSLDDAYVCGCEKPKKTLFDEDWINKVDE